MRLASTSAGGRQQDTRTEKERGSTGASLPEEEEEGLGLTRSFTSPSMSQGRVCRKRSEEEILIP